MKQWITKSGYKITRVLSGRSNVFLLSDGVRNTLIDSSVSRLWNKLQKRLDNLGVQSIDYLILTHAHFDHAANARRIKEKYHSKVVVHRDEVNYLANGENVLPRGTMFFTRPIINIIGKRLFRFFRYEPCKPDLVVEAQYDCKEFEDNLFLIHTPGHTAGSMSFIVDDEIAIVGDTLFGVFKWSVFPPYAVDTESMVRSWGKLLATNCTVFLPSHGSSVNRELVQKDYDKRINTIK